MLVPSMTIAFMVALSVTAQPAAPAPDPAQLVGQLGGFPATIGRDIDSRGAPIALEQRRQLVYRQLQTLGPAAVPALTRGLADADVQTRRNVALYLSWVGGNYDRLGAVDVTPLVTPLIGALRDSDQRVKELAAQAIEHAGAAGAPAVAELLRLLADPSVGLRNSACIGLAGIGPAARDALPALRRALSDPDPDVRRFAQRAIDKIER